MTSNAAKQVFLGDSFDGAIVYAGDSTIELNERGDITIHTNGNVTTLPGPQRKAGEVQPNRTIYAGISPDTHRPMYAQPRDMPVPMSWKQAMEGAQFFEAYGKKDWRVPSKGELKVMFENAAAIGLDTPGFGPNAWHWSSEENPDNDDTAWVERADATAQHVWKGLTLALRYVRG
jgi:hypothetical protein